MTIATTDKERALQLLEILPWNFMDDFLNASFYNSFIDMAELNTLDDYLRHSQDKFSEFTNHQVEDARTKFNDSLRAVRKHILDTFFPLNNAPDKLSLYPEMKGSSDPELRKVYQENFNKIEGLLDNCWADYKYLVSSIKSYLEKSEVRLPEPNRPEQSKNEVENDKKWEDITIKFLNGHEVIIKEKGQKPKQTNFEEMGFKNDKNDLPTVQWELLTTLSTREGEMSWRNNHDLSVKDIDAVKHRKKKLADQLKDYFKINDDPFNYDTREKSYILKIHLEPELIDEPSKDKLGISEYLEETMYEVDDTPKEPRE